MKNKSIYIIGDIVKYDNKIMLIKETRDGNRFDLFCPKEELVYCLVDVDEIKPIPLSSAILEVNGWVWTSNEYRPDTLLHPDIKLDIEVTKENGCEVFFNYYYENIIVINYVHQLQHLLFGLGLNSELKV